MRIMFWSSFSPTRWKVVVSLLPFLLTLGHVAAELSIAYEVLLTEVLSNVIFVSLAIETVVAQPLAFLLEPIQGFWSYGSLGPFPEGPLLPGSFAVAITYSIIVYITWSLISACRQQRQN
jgi:hypothetical protein